MDERDILNKYRRDIHSADYSLSGQYCRQVGQIKFVSPQYDVKGGVSSLFIPPLADIPIPRLIHSSNNLEYFDTPATPLPQIYDVNNLTKLKVLVVSYGNITFSRDIILPKLRLISSGHSVMFDTQSFPMLEAVRCRYSDKIIPVLKKIETLSSVAFQTPKDDAIHKLIPFTNLKTLYINSGKIETIEGIETLHNLEKVSLMNLRRLTDLRALTMLGKLQELQIGYCNDITDWSFLLSLNNLKYLNMPYAKRTYRPPTDIIERLEKNGILVI